ncbi:hypothetical protein NDU88_007571, partial [Pleurodeles waltl]
NGTPKSHNPWKGPFPSLSEAQAVCRGLFRQVLLQRVSLASSQTSRTIVQYSPLSSAATFVILEEEQEGNGWEDVEFRFHAVPIPRGVCR